MKYFKENLLVFTLLPKPVIMRCNVCAAVFSVNNSTSTIKLSYITTNSGDKILKINRKIRRDIVYKVSQT